MIILFSLITFTRRAVEGFSKLLGPDHIATLGAVFNLRLSYRKLGKHVEAETMLQSALEIHEKALGPRTADHDAAIDIAGAESLMSFTCSGRPRHLLMILKALMIL